MNEWKTFTKSICLHNIICAQTHGYKYTVPSKIGYIEIQIWKIYTYMYNTHIVYICRQCTCKHNTTFI